MSNLADIYLQIYISSWESIRHIEDQRTQFVSYVVAGTAVIVAAMGLGFDKLGQADKQNALMFCYISLSIIGFYGIVVIEKMFERIQFLMYSMSVISQRLDAITHDLKISELITFAETQHKLKYPLLSITTFGSLYKYPFYFLFIGGLIMAARIFKLSN